MVDVGGFYKRFICFFFLFMGVMKGVNWVDVLGVCGGSVLRKGRVGILCYFMGWGV